MLAVERHQTPRGLLLRKPAANSQPRRAPRLAGRGLPRFAGLRVCANFGSHGLLPAAGSRRAARRMRAGRGRGFAMHFSCRGILRGIYAACSEGHERED